MPPSNDRYERGTQVAARLGNTALIEELARTAPDLSRLLVEHALGDVLARPGLDFRTREAASIAMLATLGASDEHLAVHIGAGLDAGLGPGEVIEVLMQVSTFAGYPRALSAVAVAASAFQERGLPTPPAIPPRQVVADFLDSIAGGDIERVLGLLAPDVRWEVPGDPDVVPWAGHRTGREAVREFYEILLAESDRKDFGIDALTATGSQVFASGHFTYEFPRTGGGFRGEFVIVFTVEAGKITRYVMHEDSHGLAVGYAHAL
ncbi:nuclear transport factor 2 family protein [Streptomyces sp. NBC_01795]|uniref:nuclear transport factor 2 family protein n=1 Tax=unclassified Streptomyces TaxID=2593676 RepID=UPI002DDA424E|nr:MULTISPECIES: nuclear transport factor 2 family protein [unclassified Streptomyces]WSA92573.1 nuclear transport factor 2 family protein [Streptomyces sp. NBC_01795]WSB76940.1 nuclear transport factor 2 family protein [Streptomyces sp. NBC_01775]WSS14787.1 nuclear transport factor 2 family protein [Streptomyces sp. NBC_01186]